MITEDYVSFETAKLFKEKGFACATNRYYNAQYDQIRTVSDVFMMNFNNEPYMKSLGMAGAISIPTLQMAMKWLKVLHHKFITIDEHYFVKDKISHITDGFYYSYKIKHINVIHEQGGFEAPEQACEAAIKYCLENLI